jgi:hypothetical protein
VLANLGNDIYKNYGAALGFPPSTIVSMGISMAGMYMPSKGSMNMNMSGGKGMSEMNTVSTGTNQSPVTIKNLTAYQTAESLVVIAQEVFDENLKPIAQPNATMTTKWRIH